MNVFVHGFRNEMHTTRAHASCASSWVVFTSARALVKDGHRHVPRWHVSVNLFGPAWTDEDIDRSERNGRYLPTNASAESAREVREMLAQTASTWLAVR